MYGKHHKISSVVFLLADVLIDFRVNYCYKEPMTFKEKIQNDIKDAMRGKEELRLSVLRMLLSAIHNREIEKRAKGAADGLTDDEMLASVRSEGKKRRDAIEGFTKAGRQESADKESAELKILETYLPAEMSDEELLKIVEETVKNMGMVTQKEFGRVMGEVMKKTKAQASGDRVSAMVKKMLT